MYIGKGQNYFWSQEAGNKCLYAQRKVTCWMYDHLIRSPVDSTPSTGSGMLMVDSPPSFSSPLTSSIVWSLGNGYLSVSVAVFLLNPRLSIKPFFWQLSVLKIVRQFYLLLATPHYSLTVTINNYGQLMAILIVPRGHI